MVLANIVIGQMVRKCPFVNAARRIYRQRRRCFRVVISTIAVHGREQTCRTCYTMTDLDWG